MRGACHKILVPKPLAPSWDLPIVLDTPSVSSFEPLDQLDLKMVTIKTVLLLGLTSAKCMGEIHALSVNHTFYEVVITENKGD